MIFRLLLTCTAILTMIAQIAPALELGDPAPDLALEKVVQGAPVSPSLKDSGHVTVVEFWATWCGPCRESIPHLTELQAKYKDKGVRVVGITDETEDLVKSFVEKMGEKMDYTVALDDGEKTWDSYTKPFGIGGLPHAFVVDKAGTLVWHGHPMADLDEVVAQVVAGTYDVKAMRNKAKADEVREEMSELTMLWAQEYIVLARYGRDKAGADAIATKILESGYDDPTFFGQVAWTLFSNENLAYKDNDFAMKIARRANELAEGKSADVLDTLALGLFLTGEKEEAVQTQKKAIEICENEELMAQLKERLARYEGS